MIYRNWVKPLFDRFVGLILSLLLLPPLLILMAIVVLDSKGSPIFKQKRVGKNGLNFSLFKLRTMMVNAESLGGHQTLNDDPRITRVGRFVRRTSLDELPQVWNLLLGHMSLIGPRPDVPKQKQLYSEADWTLRHKVRPGITGLAQATIRSSGTMKKRTELDLKYVKDCSFSLDMKILAKTFAIVFNTKLAN